MLTAAQIKLLEELGYLNHPTCGFEYAYVLRCGWYKWYDFTDKSNAELESDLAKLKGGGIE